MSAAQAAVFSALGDPTRLEILSLVGEGSRNTATTISGSVGVSRPAVIKHLSVLEGVGLVTRSKEGRNVHFSVSADDLNASADWLKDRSRQWADRLVRLKELAET